MHISQDPDVVFAIIFLKVDANSKLQRGWGLF